MVCMDQPHQVGRVDLLLPCVSPPAQTNHRRLWGLEILAQGADVTWGAFEAIAGVVGLDVAEMEVGYTSAATGMAAGEGGGAGAPGCHEEEKEATGAGQGGGAGGTEEGEEGQRRKRQRQHGGKSRPPPDGSSASVLSYYESSH